jgi:hypothetical protein
MVTLRNMKNTEDKRWVHFACVGVKDGEGDAKDWPEGVESM